MDRTLLSLWPAKDHAPGELILDIHTGTTVDIYIILQVSMVTPSTVNQRLALTCQHKGQRFSPLAKAMGPPKKVNATAHNENPWYIYMCWVWIYSDVSIDKTRAIVNESGQEKSSTVLTRMCTHEYLPSSTSWRNNTHMYTSLPVLIFPLWILGSPLHHVTLWNSYYQSYIMSTYHPVTASLNMCEMLGVYN